MSDVAKNIKEAGMESGISTDDTTRIYERKDAYQRYQKKYIITAIISFCVGIAAIVLEGTLYPYLKLLVSMTFSLFILYYYVFFVRPVCLLSFGFFVLSVLSLWVDTRLEKRIRVVILIVGFVLIFPSLLMTVNCLLLDLAPQTIDNSFFVPGLFFSETFQNVTMFVMPILAGSALFIGFNKKKAKV